MADRLDPPSSFSRAPVPDESTVGGWRIALVLIGVAIALPAFVTGAELGRGLGFSRTILSTFAGGILLATVAAFTAVVGARSRLTTYMIILFAFGRRGGQVVNAILSLTLLGWFGVLAIMFAQAGANTALAIWSGAPSVKLLVVAGSLLMILTAIYGFKALDRMSLIVTPAKALLLIATVVAALRIHDSAPLWAPPSGGMPFGVGMSMVAGGLMVGAALMPDLCRYARSPADGVVAAFLGYGLGFPLVLIAASVPSILTGENDLVRLMIMLGLGIPAMLTVLLATWTTNTYNLYSGSLVLATIFERTPYWLLVVASGAIGTTIAFLGIADFIIPYLIVLSIGVPPIAGIYIADFFVGRRGHYDLERMELEPSVRPAAFAAWAAGILAAAGAGRYFVLTTVAACDSLIVALATYLAFLWLRRRSRSSSVAQEI